MEERQDRNRKTGRPLMRPAYRRTFEERIREERPVAPVPPEPPTETAIRRDVEEPRESVSRRISPRIPRVNAKLLGVMIAVVVAVVASGGFALWRHGHQIPLPASIRQEAAFPLYYPSPLPAGYTYDKEATTASSQLVVYTLKDTSGRAPITITSQQTPANFDASKVFDPKIAPPANIPIGNLYNLSIGQQTKYAIVTDDGTLIFITSQAKLSSSALHALNANMKRVSK